VDVEAAANAGIRCASVTWGFRDKEDLEKINPLYIADNVQELYELIKG
jgi:phosphoglycolate phosphatase